MNYSEIGYFKPYKPGVFQLGLNGSPRKEGVAFSFDAGRVLTNEEKAGLIIYERNESKCFYFDNHIHSGSLYGIYFEDLNFDEVLKYNFVLNDEIINDKYAAFYDGNSKFGINVSKNELKSCYAKDSFDWENDTNPLTKFEDLILYGLNVRAFTMHKSSKVKDKGTYNGICEKISYFKELGINGIVLMPSYEFDECINQKKEKIIPLNVSEATTIAKEEAKDIASNINCWGFIEGYYYAPKASYAATKNPVNEFKNMVKKMHEAGIEVFMQMYFEPTVNSAQIIDILKFWVHEYHIDGFRIDGFNIPFGSISKDALLKETKIWFRYINENEIDLKNGYNKYLCSDNKNIRNDLRRFLKGDEGLLNTFISYQKAKPSSYAYINYICDYDGFSLKDLYTFERKHNELNGENNIDGTEYNFSWNCGIEGETKKKSILEERTQLIKNALTILMLLSGTPYIFSGDEFGNSRYGNNNAYCQDNEIGYVEWKSNKLATELLDFTKSVIKLRKDNKILHMDKELTNTDVLSLGYPDLSYHGIEAWRPDLGFNSRMIGLFFNGKYSDAFSNSLYVGINMHWENHRIAIPKIKKNEKLVKIIDTSDYNGSSKENEIPLGKRSISIYKIV
ncbi:MAG: alpha-amylase family glycosyl hydrolase [Lachnospiraceae bacterium]|nr:alpha-amylase family glycosyl hydrolase [Lachnospiraceae bacterium]